MKYLAIVPMKEHSERIPMKNVKNFNGKPLFYWIIKTLFLIKKIEEVVVDTDSNKIASSVKDYFPRVRINFRPENLRGDFVSMNRIIENLVNKFVEYEYFIQTHATNPCLKKETIEKAIDFFEVSQDKFDSLFTVTRLQTRLYDKNFRPINHDINKLIRTQDLDPIFEENSCLYIFSRKSFLKKHSRIGEKPYLFEINKLESIDIDTIEDFKLAELIYEII